MRATWPLPTAALLILVGLFYAQAGLIGEAISLVLIVSGLVLIAWGFAPRAPKPRSTTP